MVARLGGNRNIRYFSSFGLIRGPIARAANGHETYFDVAVSWFTERVGVVRMKLKDRRVNSGGRSGYGLLSLISHARRLLMSGRIKVVRIAGAVGLLALLASLTFGGFIFIRETVSPGAFLVRGWASLIVAVVFFGGVITFMIGVTLEYFGALVLQAQGKPIFFVVDRTSDAVLSQYFARRAAQ